MKQDSGFRDGSCEPVSFPILPALQAGGSAAADPRSGGAAATTTSQDACSVGLANFAATREAREFRQRESRRERWLLQDAARALLPSKRVAYCKRRVAGVVQVYVNRAAGWAEFGGLMTCGSVWDCPVCAAKVASRRARELETAIRVHQERGGGVLLVTSTVRHHVHQRLEDLQGGLSRARRSFTSTRRYKSALSRVGFRGEVRALEVTYGKHGWHPHVHALLFVGRPLSEVEAAELLAVLRGEWAAAVDRSGLGSVSWEHGLTLERVDADGLPDSLADYFIKQGAAPTWTAADELARANCKRARSEKGRTPFGLLADFLAGDAVAGRLFQEYSEAFHGLPQLRWSRGLRAELGLEVERTDQELAEIHDQEAEFSEIVPEERWHAVVYAGARCELLERAVADSWEDVLTWLDSLPPPPRREVVWA